VLAETASFERAPAKTCAIGPVAMMAVALNRMSHIISLMLHDVLKIYLVCEIASGWMSRFVATFSDDPERRGAMRQINRFLSATAAPRGRLTSSSRVYFSFLLPHPVHDGSA
jgi:hypothetical protein